MSNTPAKLLNLNDPPFNASEEALLDWLEALFVAFEHVFEAKFPPHLMVTIPDQVFIDHFYKMMNEQLVDHYGTNSNLRDLVKVVFAYRIPKIKEAAQKKLLEEAKKISCQKKIENS